MSVKASSPKQSRIPEFKDPVFRRYIEYQRDVLFQIWSRTGGGFDRVSGRKIIPVAVDTVLDDMAYGSIVTVDTSGGTVQITLPPVVESRLGEDVIIAVIDATATTTIIPASGTVLGGASTTITVAYDRMRFLPITTAAWIET